MVQPIYFIIKWAMKYDKLSFFLSFFLEKFGFRFLVNCLLGRQFTRNVNLIFSEKITENISECSLLQL